MAVTAFLVVYLIALVLGAGARNAPPLSHRVEARAHRRTVIDYFYLLPSLGIEDKVPLQERRQLLQPGSRPVIDVRRDYLLVHPDSSPVEQIVVFRSRGRADLIADSLPDSVSDYNAFGLYRLRHGLLCDVTRQALPVPPRTDHFLYELPRFGTTIRVCSFDLNTQSRRHVFDLQWRGGRFVKVDRYDGGKTSA